MKRTFPMMILALLTCLSTWAGDVEKALEAFDKQAVAKNANLFFSELLKEEFIDAPMSFADETPADSMRQQVWYWAAEWMYDCQDFARAEKYALQALPLYHASNPEKADCLNTLGCIYVRLSDFNKAAGYAKQSVEIEMQGGDDDRISSSLNTLAGIYMAGYQAKEAEHIILQALEHAEKADNPGRKAIILGMASEVYHSLGNDEKALPYAEQAIEIERQLDRKPRLLIRLSQKASALLGLHRYAEAEAIYREIAPELKQVGDYHSYAIALNRLGMSLLCQEKQREAIPYYQEAADLFSRMGDLYNELHSHRGLYESYWSLNPDSAKIELDYFDLLKDSLYTHSTAEALSRYNAEFDNEMLQKENAEVRKAHRRTIVLGIALILLLAALALLFIRRSHKRWQRQMQELVSEIEKMKSPLPAPPLGECPNAAASSASEQQDTPPKGEMEGAESQLFLLRVIEAVNEAMPGGNFGVEQIAAELNMSVQTLRRRLQDAAGESPKAYIQAIQMERAVALLTQQTDMPIQQVANLCGFDEPSTFGHAFKRIYDCSPSEYRTRMTGR